MFFFVDCFWFRTNLKVFVIVFVCVPLCACAFFSFFHPVFFSFAWFSRSLFSIRWFEIILRLLFSWHEYILKNNFNDTPILLINSKTKANFGRWNAWKETQQQFELRERQKKEKRKKKFKTRTEIVPVQTELHCFVCVVDLCIKIVSWFDSWCEVIESYTQKSCVCSQ